MSVKKKKLGKGLDALLGATSMKSAAAPKSTVKDSPIIDDSERIQKIPLDQLDEGRYQPRHTMAVDSLQNLADSIISEGVLQPIIVRPKSDGRYEILAGHRRTQASKLAKQKTIPAIVRDVPDEVAVAVALIENIQRENLNPIEEAQGINRLISEFGLTHQQIGERVGRSRAAVSNILRLLNLTSNVRSMLENGLLDMGHARAVLTLNTAKDQDEAAAQIVEKQMSVREAEKLVKGFYELKVQPQIPSEPDKDIVALQQGLSSLLGTNVNVKHSGKKGSLTIHYYGLDELDGILQKIGYHEN